MIPLTWKTNVRQLAKLTKEKCGQCPKPFSCCADEYGEVVYSQHQKEKHFRMTNNRSSRCRYLLSPEFDEVVNAGCSVPPEFRPLCSMYVCDLHLYEDGQPQDWNEGDVPSSTKLCRDVKPSSFALAYFKLRENLKGIS